VHVRWSDRSHGDFHRIEIPLVELEARRRRFVDLPWTMLDEHHGTHSVHVGRPGEHDGERGDIAVTRVVDAVLGCWVGDCAPLVLIAGDATLACVHAGWRGLAAGVVDAAVTALGASPVAAVLGPCIGPCCYEFGRADLAAVAFGVHAAVDDVAGRTDRGTLALDVAAAVRAACRFHGVELDQVAGCTGCCFEGFSHRVRAELQRHVVAVWRTEAPT
jgi:copper oxidase (laccase) domain-containing protein